MDINSITVPKTRTPPPRPLRIKDISHAQILNAVEKARKSVRQAALIQAWRRTAPKAPDKRKSSWKKLWRTLNPIQRETCKVAGVFVDIPPDFLFTKSPGS